MPDAVLEASGLRKEYGELVAVDDVDLEVREGGSLAIVGESGSGKTTIAKMIVGLTAPTAGTIVACGRDRSTPARVARERRRRGSEVQIVFQDPYSSLDPRQTAEQALDEVLRLHRGGRRGGRAAQSSCTSSVSTSARGVRCPAPSPVASASASRSRARSPRNHASSSSTSPSRRSTSRSRRRSSTCSPTSARRPASPTS